jgi:hypothetical protein
MSTLKYSIPLEQINEGCEVKSFIIIDNIEKKWYDEQRFLSLYDREARASIDEQIEGEVEKDEIQFLLKQVFAEANLTDAECRQLLSNVLKDRKSVKDAHGFFKLPDTAPELYENRKRPESPVDFYNRIWRRYEEAGLLFQSDLRRLDSKLIPAIHTFCSRKGLEARDHLPPSQAEKTKTLAKAGDRHARQLLKTYSQRAQSRESKPDAAP